MQLKTPLFLLTSIIILLLNIQLSFAQQSYNVLIKNGKIIDGSGNSWYIADIAVKDGKIVLIQKNIIASAVKIIDAKGLIVAPGFIDVHTHIVFRFYAAGNWYRILHRIYKKVS